MQFKILKILLVFGFLQTFKLEAIVWAQDVVSESSIEQTTRFISSKEEWTAKANSLENLASSETIDEKTTTTAAIEKCENNKSVENTDKCDCKCADKYPPNEANSAEETTTPTSEEKEQTTTIATNENEQVEQSTEITEAPTANIKPESAPSTNSKDTTEKPNLPVFNCETVGNFANPNDCHRYFICKPIENSTNFELTENNCPTAQAFNTEFSSCMRDLSPCTLEHGGFQCLEAGSFADPEGNATAYYRCVPRLGEQSTATFHVYHINCGIGKMFMPQLGKCFYDLNALQTDFNFNQFNGMPDDEQLVKAELKQWKLKEKSKLKEEKFKLKYEKKLQKELAKKANKEAKEKAKKEEKAKKGKNMYDDDYD